MIKKTAVSAALATVFAVSLLLLPGCNMFPGDDADESGTGFVRLSLGDDLRRTIQPNVQLTDFAAFRLDFTGTSAEILGQTVTRTWNQASLTAGQGTAELLPGDWDLTVFAFLDPPSDFATMSTPLSAAAAVGTLTGDITVTANTSTPAGNSVMLVPLDAGSGDFRLVVNLAGGATVTQGSIQVIGPLPTTAVFYNEPLPPPALDTITHTIPNIPRGDFRVILVLENDDGRAGAAPVLQIYPNMESVWNNALSTFGPSDFILPIDELVLRGWNHPSSPNTWNFHTDIILDVFDLSEVSVLGLSAYTGTVASLASRLTDLSQNAPAGALSVYTFTRLRELADAALIELYSETGTFRSDTARFADRAAANAAISAIVRPNATAAPTITWPAENTAQVDTANYRVLIEFYTPVFADLLAGTAVIGGFTTAPTPTDTLTVDVTITSLPASRPYALQWQRSADGIAAFTDITGQTGTSLDLAALATAVGEHFRVVVTCYYSFGSFESASVGPVVDIAMGGSDITLVFAEFEDRAYNLPVVGIAPLYRLPTATSVTLTVTPPPGATVTWENMFGVELGTGVTLVLAADNPALGVGANRIMVRIATDTTPVRNYNWHISVPVNISP